MQIPKLLLIMLLGAVSVTASAIEPILYKGLSWSTSPTQLKKKHPSFYCKKEDRETRCLSNTETYYGRKVSSSYLHFIDNELKHVEIKIEFSKDNSVLNNPELYSMAVFVEMKKELINRYGEAEAPDEYIMLAKAEKTTASWKTDVASLLIFVAPKEKSKTDDFIVQVMFSTSDYERLTSEIHQTKRSKDM